MYKKKKLEEPYRPFIFPYILFRKEGFGALLFNYRTCSQLMLDVVEAYIAGLCDGRHTVRSIEALTTKKFTLSPPEGIAYVQDTLSRLAQFLAISAENSDLLARCVESRPWPVREASGLSSPTTVYWEVTHACNLKCKHCLTASGRRSAKELTTEQAFSLIGQLADAKVMELVITGGEPFLRPDILDILRRLSDEKICVKVDTNATALGKKVFDNLRELKVFCFQVSIDGIGDRHDEFRGKKGAFDATSRAIRRLVDSGMRVNVLTTVTPENIDELDLMIDHARDLGCGEIILNPFIQSGRGKLHPGLKLSTPEHYRMYSTALRRAADPGCGIKVSTEKSFSFFFNGQESTEVDDGPMGCAVGNSVLTIGADGNVYPCPFLHDFSLGNAMESPITDIWKKNPLLKQFRRLSKKSINGKCRDCRFAPELCSGGCRARAYFEYGDMRAQDPACILQVIEDKASL